MVSKLTSQTFLIEFIMKKLLLLASLSLVGLVGAKERFPFAINGEKCQKYNFEVSVPSISNYPQSVFYANWA